MPDMGHAGLADTAAWAMSASDRSFGTRDRHSFFTRLQIVIPKHA